MIVVGAIVVDDGGDDGGGPAAEVVEVREAGEGNDEKATGNNKRRHEQIQHPRVVRGFLGCFLVGTRELLRGNSVVV